VKHSSLKNLLAGLDKSPYPRDVEAYKEWQKIKPLAELTLEELRFIQTIIKYPDSTFYSRDKVQNILNKLKEASSYKKKE
jgi:hypothetical protein